MWFPLFTLCTASERVYSDGFIYDCVSIFISYYRSDIFDHGIFGLWISVLLDTRI